MTLKDILTTYWSQVTLVLLGLGYLIKNVIDSFSIKRQTNHNLFQQNKINALDRFFDSYSKVEQMWTGIAIWDILNNQFQAKEIDNIIQPVLNQLKASVLGLQIYFNGKEYESFEKIVENVISINSKLLEVYFDYDFKESVTSKVSKFERVKGEKLSDNNIVLKQIGEMVKKSFKS